MAEGITDQVRRAAANLAVGLGGSDDLHDACDAIDAAFAAKDARIAEYDSKVVDLLDRIHDLESDNNRIAALTAERDRLRQACESIVAHDYEHDSPCSCSVEITEMKYTAKSALTPPAPQPEPGVECSECHGEGQELTGEAHGGWQETVACHRCGGEGRILPEITP